MSMLLVAVVADELEEHALRIAHEEGIRRASVMEAHGIGFPEHKVFFGVTYQGLEKVLLWLAEEDVARRASDRLNTELKLLQPFQGLAFCLPVTASSRDLPARS